MAKEIAETEGKVEEKKITQKTADKEIEREVKEEIKEEPKKENEIKPKKTEAIVRGRNLPISIKHAVAICNLIREKNIDTSILVLEKAEKMKIAVPMRGEISHRKGKIMSGRYPIKAVKEFIRLLKSLKANALMNELETEKYKISCKADVAPRAYRRFGAGRFKRSHVDIKLIMPIKKTKRK